MLCSFANRTSSSYCKSVNGITHRLLGIRQTIPSTPLDGGKEIQEMIAEIKYPKF